MAMMQLPKTLITRQYHTIDKINIMSDNNEQQQQQQSQGNAILTEKEVKEQQQQNSLNPTEVQATSSINTNAEQNGQPVYTTNDPLMQPPTEEQKQQIATAQERVFMTPSSSSSSAEQQPPRSNTQDPPQNNLTSIDATIQGLYIQILALQHNKIQQITGNNQQ
jgi:hypothetical protein